MPIPGQNITIIDPGLGLVEPAVTTPLYLGVSESGTNNELKSFSRKSDVVAEYGQGPLSEGVCRCLDDAGGPVLAMKLLGDGTASNTAVTKTAVGASTGTITVAGTPNDSYEAIITIDVTGDVGAGTFRYSLDDGHTQSEEILIPAGGSFAIPETGLTLTFVSGMGTPFFESGDTHEFDSTADHYTVVSLAAGFVNIAASLVPFAFIVLTGTPSTAAASATLFGGLETQLASLENSFVYTRAMIDAGSSDTPTAVGTAYAAVEDSRISAAYGSCDVSSSKPFSGWGSPKRDATFCMAGRAAAVLVSTDLARTADGSLNGVKSIDHNEFFNEVLDIQRISTYRTWPGYPGFYITNTRLKSSPGSDFRWWQYGRVMDVACTTTYKTQQLFISQGIRTNSDGTINELDARRFETRGISALQIQLTQPRNAEGTGGHVSDVNYTIDRTNNVAVSETVVSEVAVRPLGYAKFITTTIGFSLTV